MESVFLSLRILMSLALYSFLGWALWLLWRSLSRQSEKAGAPQFPALILTRMLEAEGEPQLIRFSRPEVSVGRQPGSDLHLEDSAISARHARLTYHHGQWWVEDLHSRNGTFLNDERISASLVLATGDELRFGGQAFQVEIESLAPADEP